MRVTAGGGLALGPALGPRAGRSEPLITEVCPRPSPLHAFLLLM